MLTKTMQHWLKDPDFKGASGPEAIAKLPESERAEWTKLWQDVAALGKQAAERKAKQQTPATPPEPVPAPKELGTQNKSSFDLINRPLWVARDELLALRINQQIKLFQHDRADQGILTLRFDDGGKRAVAAEKFDVSTLGFLALGTPAVSITNLDFAPQRQAQIFRDRLRQHQHCRPGINHAGYRLPANMLRGQDPVFRQGHVLLVGNLEFDTESSHAVGSFAAHDRTPARTFGG
jgi:hypothetical protein